MKLIALLFALPFSYAVSVSSRHDSHEHAHKSGKRLPTKWYHDDDNPVHSMFKRAPTDGTQYAQVGSPAWSAGFPKSTPDPNNLPLEWVNALNAAVSAGKIPDIPPSSNTPQTNPVYPQGVDPNSPKVCSATYKCRNAGDIWDAPTGVLALSFDDGPQPPTIDLANFLKQKGKKATHFLIGVNILQFPDEFNIVFAQDEDIAVHTWTHPYMTTLSNGDIVGQLGWSMELIHNSTGGRIPRYWRPPFGDSDERVRAIAKELFNLTTVIWNQDTEDWSLTSGGTTPQIVQASMQKWLTGPKTPGLIILEHEISKMSVDAFINAYNLIESNGWNIMSLAEIPQDGGAYRNSKDSSSDVIPAGILANDFSTSSDVASSSSNSASQSSSSSTTNSAGNLAASSTTTSTANSGTAIETHGDLLYILSLFLGATIMTLMTVWW